MSQYNSEIHHRCSIRLQGYDYSKDGLYFLTLCSQKQLFLFCEIIDSFVRLSEIGEIINTCWNSIPTHYPDVILHEFVVMPNHIHGIIEITKPIVRVENFQPLQSHRYQHVTSRSIASIVRGFKIGTTKQIGYSVWQRNYYDHVIRNDAEYRRIAQYIENNPANWGKDRFYGNDDK